MRLTGFTLRFASILAFLLLSGCGGGETGAPAPDGSSGAPVADGGGRPDSTTHAPAPDGGATGAAAPDAGRPAARPEAPPTKAPPRSTPACRLTGPRHELTGVVAATALVVGGRPMVLAITDRPRRTPLDIEGSEPLPVMRSLYAATVPAAAGEEVSVRRLLDDPGPIRDHFGRRSYERLVGAAGACDGAGCLVVAAVAHDTPGIDEPAFINWVLRLDEEGDPEGAPSPLTREPDRGERVALCVGITGGGYLIGASVRPGRGRLLWLDRRATPLDLEYVPEGFDQCSILALATGAEVVLQSEGGLRFHELGSTGEPDGGAGSWRPEVGERGAAPAATQVGDLRVLCWSDAAGVRCAAPSTGTPAAVFDAEAEALSAAATGDGAVLAALGDDGAVAVARLDAALHVTARSASIVTGATGVQALAGSEGATWLAWSAGDTFSVRRLECPATGADSTEGEPSPLVDSARLAAADRRDAARLTKLARLARSRRQNYRAAWLLERAYHEAPNDPTPMIEAAGLLTEIRYTKSSLRMLERLSNLEGSEIRLALRTTCTERDFERLWRSQDFQRITGCNAPPEEPDAGAEGEENEEAEGVDDAPVPEGEDTTAPPTPPAEPSPAEPSPAEPAPAADEEGGE